jgi:hypothetical protein
MARSRVVSGSPGQSWLVICPRLFLKGGGTTSAAQKPLATLKFGAVITAPAAGCPIVPLSEKLPPVAEPPPPAITDEVIAIVPPCCNSRRTIGVAVAMIGLEALSWFVMAFEDRPALFVWTS